MIMVITPNQISLLEALLTLLVVPIPLIIATYTLDKFEQRDSED